MNVATETTIATKTQPATTLLDHLVALAILASLEMEPIVKVCLSDIKFIYYRWDKHYGYDLGLDQGCVADLLLGPRVRVRVTVTIKVTVKDKVKVKVKVRVKITVTVTVRPG